MAELRKDKTCLNCGCEVEQRFCPACGQENIDPRESFWLTVKHLFGQYFLYDSKIISSLKPLFLKPGMLTVEYNAGKREKFVHPLRFYVFVSIFFFYFSPSNPEVTLKQPVTFKYNDKEKLEDVLPLNRQAYLDSIAKMPGAEQPGFFEKNFMLQLVKMKEKGIDNFKKEFFSIMISNAPKMMFFLLPLVALLLNLLYRKQKWFFSEHFIMSLHLHSFIFLINFISNVLEWYISDFFSVVTTVYIMIYLYLAIKNVYGKNKIVLKYLSFLMMYFFAFIICLTTLSIVAILQM